LEIITASNFKPVGLDIQLLQHIESNVETLSLDESVVYKGLIVPQYDDSHPLTVELCIVSKHHGCVLFHISNSCLISDDDKNLAKIKRCFESSFRDKGIAIPVYSHLFINGSDVSLDLKLISPTLSNFSDIDEKLTVQKNCIANTQIRRANRVLHQYSLRSLAEQSK